jgi:hypothetical protein
MLCLPRSRKRLPSLCISDVHHWSIQRIYRGGVQRLPSCMALGMDRVSSVRIHGGDSIADVRALSVFLRMRLVSLCPRCFLTDRTKTHRRRGHVVGADDALFDPMNEFPYIRRCINDLSNGKPRNREASVLVGSRGCLRHPFDWVL